MSKSQARFTKNGNVSSRMSFAGGAPAGAKKVGVAAPSEGPGGRSTLQVIFNGKIATPQSLLGRKPAPNAGSVPDGPRRSTSWAPRDMQLEGATTVSMMIEETEFPEKSVAAKAKSKNEAAEMLRAGRLSSLDRGVQPSVGAKKGVEQDEVVMVLLRETCTETVLSLPSFITASDMREVAAVEERNARYEAVVASHRIADGGYISRPTQTTNNPQKNQNDMAAPSALRDFGVQVTAYEILDETVDNSPDQQDDVGVNVGVGSGGVGGGVRRASVGGAMLADEVADSSRLSESVKKFVADTVTLSLVTPGCLLDVDDLSRPPPPGESREPRHSVRVPRGVRTSLVATVSGNLISGLSRMSNEDSDHGGNDSLRKRRSSRDKSGSMPAPNQSSAQGLGAGTSGVTMVSQVGSRQHSRDGSEGEGQWTAQELSEEETLQVLRDNEADGILSSKLLLKRLLMLERAVQQNAYHRQHLDYRDLPDVVPVMLRKSPKTALSETSTDHQHFGSTILGGGAAGRRSIMHHTMHTSQTQTENADGFSPSSSQLVGGGSASSVGEGAAGSEGDNPKVKRLFRYYSEELVQGRAVTSMVWNTLNSDLLAVGYGKIDTFVDSNKLGEEVDEQLQGGLVLFWSLRNPEHPEKIMRTAHPVVSLDFSKISPMLLAVGQANGDVSVYDVKRETDCNTPLQSSAGMVGGHTDPVWQLKWVMKRTERFERFETLISISTDGSVLEWTTKKGFAVSTLMQLKRAGMGEGWISRQAAGLSFDFVPSDPSTYVTGTEEGSLHRCSVSYNEQYLDTYQGHQGPVYKVKFSPRWHSVFLSCSADWTIGVWHLHSKTPLLSMKASGEENAINDIAWCPDNSTIFAAVTADAKLQIWDLNTSSIDPIVTLDTASDDVLENKQANKAKSEIDETENNNRMDTAASPSITPGIAGGRTRQGLGRGGAGQSAPNAPVAQLLKNLSQSVAKRSLTCLQFGEKSPTVVVGDNRGAVTVYRILDPITITHEGPVQQMTKLKQAIMRQSDPTSTARLRKNEGEEVERGAAAGAPGGGVTVEVEDPPTVGGKGPPSSNSVAGGSKRSIGTDEYPDLPTNDGNEEGFAFSSDKEQEGERDSTAE